MAPPCLPSRCFTAGWVTLLAALTESAGASGAVADLGGPCLDDAAANESLTYLVVDGVTMPLGVWNYQWSSAEVLGYLYALLARDVLGYAVAWSGTSGFSVVGLLAVAGCDAPTNVTDPQCKGTPAQTAHVVLEFWTNNFYNMRWLETHYPDSVPEDLGSIGYTSVNGMYVTRAVLDAGAADGVHLEYYGAYNSLWYNVAKYFDDYRAVPVSDLLPCNATELSQSDVMAKVVRWYPDPEIGLIQGRLQANCPDGFWWLSPGCRRSPSLCIPFVTGGDGWYVAPVMQRSIAHSLPLAIATAADDARYRSLPHRYRMLAYWWEPADHFLDLAPQQLAFPRYNGTEWSRGIYQGASREVQLTKNVYRGLSTVAPRAYKLAQQISVDTSILSVLLQDVSASRGGTRGAACRWLRANAQVWKAWLPRATECPSGWGLVSSTTAYVDERAAAVDCSPCPAGSFSSVLVDPDGVTRACRACGVGFVQPQRGSDGCVPCEAGYYQSQTGQSLCTRCDKGTIAPTEGSSACVACPAGRTTDGTGFRAGADCQCAPGTFLAQATGDCVPCGEGSSCPGFGGEPTALPGYQLGGIEDDRLRLFKCFGAPSRCPGGGVGKCAVGREGVACALCYPGWTPSGDGSCDPCKPQDSAPFALTFVAACLLLVAVYRGARAADRAKQSQWVLLAGTTCSQVVVVLQVIGVFSRLSVAWLEPVRSVMGILRVLTLDIQVLRMDCIGSFPPIARYICTIALLPAGLLYLATVHVCARLAARLLRRPGASGRGSLPSDALIASMGTLCLVLIIAIATLTMEPLQCQQHPNGMWTMVQYESVVCWRGGVQSAMIGIGMCFMLLPTAFVSASACVIHMFPKRMEQGDVRFLNTFSFLLYRVKPEARWLVLGFLLRNLFIALTPVITQTFLQMFMLQVLFVASLVLLLAYSPWRVPGSNRLDVATHLGLAGFGYVSTFFVHNSDLHATALISAIIIIGGLVLLAIAAVATLLPLLFARKQRYQWFLCHQKAAAGATARLLKLALVQETAAGKVFIDADNLDDLDQLFGIVAHDVATLVVLCSKDIFRRTWCLGEVVAAYVNRVDTLVVRFPDFLPPDAAFIGSIETVVKVNILSEGGFRVSDAQEALEWLLDREHIAGPPVLDRRATTQLVAGIRRQRAGGAAAAGPAVVPGRPASAVILADPTDREATAAALILQRLVSPLLADEPALIPVLYDELPLESDGPLLGPLATLLVLCTTGCFRVPLVLSALMRAQVEGVSVTVPVIVEEGFRFPTPAFYADLELDAASLQGQQCKGTAAALLVQFVEVMFRKIALTFNTMGSLQALQSQSSAVARRLLARATAPKRDVRRTVGSPSLVHALHEVAMVKSDTGEQLQLIDEPEEPEDKAYTGHPVRIDPMGTEGELQRQGLWEVPRTRWLHSI